MIFHPKKSKVIGFYGNPPPYNFCNGTIEVTCTHRDLGLIMNDSLTWTAHIDNRLKRAYKSIYLIKRNTSTKLSCRSKVNFYKRTVIPILCYASPCWYATRADMTKLELLQNRTTRWIVPSVKNYRARPAQLELLPFPLYLQMLDVLTLVKMCNSQFDYDFSDVFSIKPEPRREKRLIPVCLKKPRTEFMQEVFFVRTCPLIFHIRSIDVTKPLGIKAQILRLFWGFFESKYSGNNL